MAFDISVILSNWGLFARGLTNTILFSTIAIVGGVCVGAIVALGRISRLTWLRLPASFFVEIVRNTPFLIQVFIAYYVLPAFGVSLDATTAGIASLLIFAGAYFSESIRGAILSVPKGQMDAARATGMSYLLAMRRVIFPQMLGYLIPSITNQSIGVVKESSVLSIITVPEVTMAAQIVLGVTFGAIEAYTAVALLYWIVTATLAKGMRRLERRTLAYHLPGSGPFAVEEGRDT